jgi:hypothetical protein
LSLSGPLRGKKGYLKTILEPKGIKVQSILVKSQTNNQILYEFIWDTASRDPHATVIETTIMAHLEEFLVTLSKNSIKTQRVVRRAGPRSISSRYRHTANVEIYQ